MSSKILKKAPYLGSRSLIGREQGTWEREGARRARIERDAHERRNRGEQGNGGDDHKIMSQKISF